MSAYEFGYVMGRVLMLGGGLTLFVIGNRLHRTTTRSRREAVEGHAALGGTGDAAVLPDIRGTKRRAAGILLLLVAVLGTVGSTTSSLERKQAVKDTRLALPDNVLGLQRADAVARTQIAQVQSSFATEFEEVVSGYYGAPFGGVFVIAARGEVHDPVATVGAAFKNVPLPSGLALSAPAEVAPADGGKTARCAAASTSDAATRTGFVCAFAGDATFVLVVDTTASSLEDAADNGRTVHRFVIRRADDPQPAPPSPTPSPTPAVSLALPTKLLGATRDMKSVAKERAEFIRESIPLTQADLGLYVGDHDTFLVEAASGDLHLTSLFVREFRRGLAKEAGMDPGEPTSVDPGPLGGEGHCWRISLDGTPTVVCLFIDDHAYVAVYDLDGRTLPVVAERARRIRPAVEKRR